MHRHLMFASCALATLLIGGTSSWAATTTNVRQSTSASELRLDDEKKDEKGESIDIDKLPKLVVDAVKKAMPGSRITKASKLEKDGKTTYYLDDVKVGKKGWDVTVADDGTIVKKEECHDDD